VTVLAAVRQLLAEPNPDDPLDQDATEAYLRNRPLFDSTARRLVAEHASGSSKGGRAAEDAVVGAAAAAAAGGEGVGSDSTAQQQSERAQSSGRQEEGKPSTTGAAVGVAPSHPEAGSSNPAAAAPALSKPQQFNSLHTADMQAQQDQVTAVGKGGSGAAGVEEGPTTAEPPALLVSGGSQEGAAGLGQGEEPAHKVARVQ